MKYFKNKLNNLCFVFNGIKLVDRFLIIIMVIIIIQICISLFTPTPPGESENIDNTIRGTGASIFGYFVSENFIKTERTETDEILNYDLESSEHQNCLPGNNKNYKKINSIRLQIIIVSLISILCILVIIISRNFVADNNSATASITQLKDFICAGVGFLLGHNRSSCKKV